MPFADVCAVVEATAGGAQTYHCWQVPTIRSGLRAVASMARLARMRIWMSFMVGRVVVVIKGFLCNGSLRGRRLLCR